MRFRQGQSAADQPAEIAEQFVGALRIGETKAHDGIHDVVKEMRFDLRHQPVALALHGFLQRPLHQDQRRDARQKFLFFEGFGEIIVGADGQRPHNVVGAVADSEDEHRQFQQGVAFPNGPAHFVTGNVGHHQVQHHQIERLPLDPGEGLTAVACAHDAVGFIAEMLLQHFQIDRLVVHDENRRRHRFRRDWKIRRGVAPIGPVRFFAGRSWIGAGQCKAKPGAFADAGCYCDPAALQLHQPLHDGKAES